MADYGELYKKIGEDYDVNTAAYRFANYPLPEDIPVLTSDTASELLTQDMSGQIEKLLFLFGADVITEEDVNRLFGISQDISGVLNEAESFLKMDNKRTEKERMLREVFRTALVSAAVSAQYTSEDERLSFLKAITTHCKGGYEYGIERTGMNSSCILKHSRNRTEYPIKITSKKWKKSLSCRIIPIQHISR